MSSEDQDRRLAMSYYHDLQEYEANKQKSGRSNVSGSSGSSSDLKNAARNLLASLSGETLSDDTSRCIQELKRLI